MKNTRKQELYPKQVDLGNAFNKLNEAMRAFGEALGCINGSVKNFCRLAEECNKHKL